MNRVLIIADGEIAEGFIKKISTKNISELSYTIVIKECSSIDIQSHNIEYIKVDATSIYRLKGICSKSKFLATYIIMQNPDEAKAVYSNIRAINERVRIVLLDTNEQFKELEDSYTNIVDVIELLANRLYDFLPNVPVTAQTIGLNEGEIMEVIVPFSSAYAFRHINSIPQIKWKIAGIYRDNKLLLPTNATMIRPRDRLLLVGKPQVLINVYKRIRSKSGIFPEPFGKNFYLYLDVDRDRENIENYIEEAIYLLDKFDNKSLIIRVANPNDLEIVEKIKSYENSNIRAYFSYSEIEEGIIATDVDEYDIGLIFISSHSLLVNSFSKKLYAYKKLVYIFGATPIKNIKEAVVVKSDDKETEEISSVAFYIAETLKVKLSLRDYNPQGDFEDSKMIVEHFETLSHVHSIIVQIVQEKENPIHAIKQSKDILLVIPFKENMNFNTLLALFKRDVDSLLLRTNSHPKLLIPIVESWFF